MWFCGRYINADIAQLIHLVHTNMPIFTVNGWNYFVLAVVLIQKVSVTDVTGINSKNKEILKKFIKQFWYSTTT